MDDCRISCLIAAVFKKFEKENLFQIMCAGMSSTPCEFSQTPDIVERFQLSLMLTVIALRNMIEMSGSDIAFLPKSFMRGKSLVESIFSVRRRGGFLPAADAPASPVRHCLGNVGGLAQTRLHNEIQPRSRKRIRSICRYSSKRRPARRIPWPRDYST